jgi:signal transduction histidine kinase
MDEARCREMVELVRSVRHDVNSPLTAALGNVQLLADEPAVDDPEVKESLKVIERELRRMMEILARLKDVKAD